MLQFTERKYLNFWPRCYTFLALENGLGSHIDPNKWSANTNSAGLIPYVGVGQVYRAFTCILFDLPEVIDDLSWLRDKDCLFGAPGPGVKETLSPRLLLALLFRFALQGKIGLIRSALSNIKVK